MSVMAFAQGGNITYVLNGGVFNDDGWQNKSDMFDALKKQSNPTFDWKTLEYYMAQTDPLGAPNICSGLINLEFLNTDAERWGWLKTYIIEVTAAQIATSPTLMPTALAAGDALASNANWRYAVAAFFANTQRASWPISANFAEAGKPAAFMPAWKHAFAGPNTYDGTKEIILPVPFNAAEPFIGWFDNEECKGFPITSIPAGASGDKKFYAKYGETNPGGDEWTITYNLNGGVTNDGGWQNKNDMYMALYNSWNTFKGGGQTAWKTIPELLALADPVAGGIPTQAATMDLTFIQDAAVKEQWQWLIDYMDAVCTAQGRPAAELPSANASYLRYNLAAFFVNGFRASWPISGNYATAGQPAAFIPAWGHAFAGPATYDGSVAIVIPDPYRKDFTFSGWFANAAFSGNKIASIPVGTNGNIELFAKWIEYVPTCKEVWNLGAGKNTYAAGVVTFVNEKTAYIQDATAGLMIEFTTAPAIATGNLITVEGTTAAWGDYVKVTAAKLEGKEAATLPAAAKVTLPALATNMFKYVLIEGLRITAYTGANPTLSNGVNSVTLVSALNQTTFPVNSLVNVKAVVSFDGTAIILTGYPSDVSKAPVAAVDPAVYPAKGDKGQYTLKNRWIISNFMDNFSANRLGTADFVRGMTAKNDKMYFIDRENKQLVVVDGATGDKLPPIKLGAEVFTREGAATPATLNYNDIKQDAKGNILVGNLISATQYFQVWKIDLATGNGKLVVEERLADNPDFATATVRFDAFGVCGDVDKNAIIMASNASAMDAYKWTITNGVAAGAEYIPIDVTEDGTFLKGLTNPGTAPQIFPIDENYFYLDGNATLPTLIDMDGNIVDGFYNVPAEDLTAWFGNRANAVGHNGLAEFELGGEHFFIMASGNTLSTPPSTFALLKFKDANKEFKDIQLLWNLPANGMGGSGNAYRTGMPVVAVNETTKTATIYLYTGENGYGVYEFKSGAGSGLEPITVKDNIKIGVSGNTILLSENVANIRIFNLMGQSLQQAQGVSSINIPNSGIYIVNIQTLQGEIVTKKVIIR